MLKRATILGALGIWATLPAQAQTELQWWHAMAGGNHDLIVSSEEFNGAQKDYKIVPVYKGSYADTMTAGLAAFRAGNPPQCRPSAIRWRMGSRTPSANWP